MTGTNPVHRAVPSPPGPTVQHQVLFGGSYDRGVRPVLTWVELLEQLTQ